MALARGGRLDKGIIRLGNLTIDTEGQQVQVAGRLVHFPALQYRLLLYLVQNAGRVIPQKRLLEQVWGESSEGSLPKVRVQICKLRAALHDSDPWKVQTLSKRGYSVMQSPQ